jgi:hypothetical protein
MATTTAKLSVWAPTHPGHSAVIVGECDTMAEARQIAERFGHRRDLSYQDVFVRLGRDGKIIERCGPCR